MTPYARKLVFRIIPLSFTLGAGIEWFMLRVQIGRETFCECPSRSSLRHAPTSSPHIRASHTSLSDLPPPATALPHAPSSGPSQPGLTHGSTRCSHPPPRSVARRHLRPARVGEASRRACFEDGRRVIVQSPHEPSHGTDAQTPLRVRDRHHHASRDELGQIPGDCRGYTQLYAGGGIGCARRVPARPHNTRHAHPAAIWRGTYDTAWAMGSGTWLEGRRGWA